MKILKIGLIVLSLSIPFVSLAQSPLNDSCATAAFINYEEIIIGSTLESTLADAPINDCTTHPFTSSNAPGLWYRFIGNGELVSISTCSDTTDFDTYIGLFSGDCQNLVCEEFSDYGFEVGCSNEAYMQYPASSGQDYYIYISGFDGQRGIFSLRLSSEPCDTGVMIIGQPVQNLVGNADGLASFSIELDGNDNSILDWEVKCENGEGWQFVNDAIPPHNWNFGHEDQLTIPLMPIELDSCFLRCRITTNCETVYSDSILIRVNPIGTFVSNGTFNNEFIVYPNPSKGLVSLNLGLTKEDVVFTLYNVVGDLLYSGKLESVQEYNFQLPETKGLYLLQLVDSNQMTTTLKVVKE